MSRQRVSIKTNPKVLQWALNSTGWETKELAEKTKIDRSSISLWQKQESEIPLHKLKKIAKSIKVPLDVLFLPAPPKESDLPYYRTVGGSTNKKPSKKMCEVIRHTRYVQSVAAEMLDMRRQTAEPQVRNTTLRADPAAVADAVRSELNLGPDFRKNLVSNPRIAYNQLRTKIESRNIFVLQRSMPLDEARGFSLTKARPQVILVNSADEYRPRVFTLLHEFGHILLNKESICMPNHEIVRSQPDNIRAVEKWCNAFAGSLLMPEAEFLEEFAGCETDGKTPDNVVYRLARKFGVSKRAACVRILSLLTDRSRKKPYSEYYNNSGKKWDKRKKSSGGPNPATRCLSGKGSRFVNLIVDSHSRDLITYTEKARYLELNSDHFEELEAKIWR